MLPIQKQAEQYVEAEQARDEALAPQDEATIETFNIPRSAPVMTADP